MYTEDRNSHSEGEKIMRTKRIALFVLSVVVGIAAACGSPSAGVPQGKAESVLTQEEATTMIDRALQALNTGDYAAWSRDWDEDMKAAIRDKDFQSYRDQVVAQYGQYVSLESVEIQPGLQKGNVRWVAIAGFQKGRIKFSFGFANEGRLIQGIFPEAAE
jgi:hypothetical protein